MFSPVQFRLPEKLRYCAHLKVSTHQETHSETESLKIKIRFSGLSFIHHITIYLFINLLIALFSTLTI